MGHAGDGGNKLSFYSSNAKPFTRQSLSANCRMGEIRINKFINWGWISGRGNKVILGGPFPIIIAKEDEEEMKETARIFSSLN